MSNLFKEPRYVFTIKGTGGNLDRLITELEQDKTYRPKEKILHLPSAFSAHLTVANDEEVQFDIYQECKRNKRQTIETKVFQRGLGELLTIMTYLARYTISIINIQKPDN